MDAKEGAEYGFKGTVDQMFDFILGKVEAIGKQLEKGLDDKSFSRLRHYALRVVRFQAKGSQAEKLKDHLSSEINGLLDKFNSKKPSDDKNGKKIGVDEQNKRSNAGLRGIEELLNAEKDKYKDKGAESLDLMKQNEEITQRENEAEENVETKLRTELEEQKTLYEQRIKELEAKLERVCKIVEERNISGQENLAPQTITN